MSESKLHDKLDKIDNRLNSIDVHLAKYNAQLEYHIQRTDALEVLVIETAADLKPVMAHVEQVRGAAKFIALLGTIGSIIGAVIGTIMHWIRH